MTGRPLELRISQLADGTLPAEERAGVQAEVDSNARSNQAFDEYRRLNARMDRALATPAVRWDALAEQLSTAVAASAERPAVAGRIARSSAAAVWRRGVSVAACLLVAAGAGLLAIRTNHTAPPLVKTAALPPSSVVVGPQVELARGNPSVQITIGPSPAVALQGGEWRYAEGVVTAPSKVQFFSRATPDAAGDPHLH